MVVGAGDAEPETAGLAPVGRHPELGAVIGEGPALRRPVVGNRDALPGAATVAGGGERLGVVACDHPPVELPQYPAVPGGHELGRQIAKEGRYPPAFLPERCRQVGRSRQLRGRREGPAAPAAHARQFHGWQRADEGRLQLLIATTLAQGANRREGVRRLYFLDALHGKRMGLGRRSRQSPAWRDAAHGMVMLWGAAVPA